MDVDQRKYLIERVKQEYNNVIAPFKSNPKKFDTPNYYSIAEMEEMLKAGDWTRVERIESNPYNRFGIAISFKTKPVTTPKVDYTSILEKLATEKNKVLDEIMLGDLPDAATVLKNFINFLSTEKEKLNVN